MKKATKLISKCKDADVDAVKFQMWRAADLYNSDHPDWNFIKKSEVTFKTAKKLKEICDDHNIEFYCSAFYPEAVDHLESLNVKRYKVASRTCLLKDPFSKETLKRKADTKKHVIISMGMGGDKKYIKKIFSKNKTTFCYCISEYPLQIKKINWKNATQFDGFSDHTLGITAPIIYATLKKYQGFKNIMIEKHIKLKNSKGPDASSSIDTEEFSKMIKSIRLVENSKLS
ncbi:MAG TPA: shikimate dehydrogenase [Candidatus Nitrosopelagicus sp.]|mgnify:FL=1|jgi:sialic acid synthase SpsE|nr:shikimate dehydrogenase [Candidatus Nitrosopelagicus sp.]